MKNFGGADRYDPMTDVMEIAPDIAILLAHSWKNHGGQPIDEEVACRIWTFDMGWFDMDTSTRVRDNLVRAGWIDQSSEGLKPAIDISGIHIPLGWMPTMRVLDNPPTLPKGTSVTTVVNNPVSEPERKEPVVQSVPIDPAAAHITDLLDQISNSSGLERKEVMRRAQRKRRALGPVTLWMALLLVAREQKLAMQPLMRTLTG